MREEAAEGQGQMEVQGPLRRTPPKGNGRQVKMHPSENPPSRDHTSSRAAYVGVNQGIFTTGICYWNSIGSRNSLVRGEQFQGGC